MPLKSVNGLIDTSELGHNTTFFKATFPGIDSNYPCNQLFCLKYINLALDSTLPGHITMLAQILA
jgi:hypothetical protein